MSSKKLQEYFPKKESIKEELLEALFWEVDSQSKITGEPRITFKNYVRGFLNRMESVEKVYELISDK